MRAEWEGFNNGAWQKEINVRDFIQKNYTPYDGDESFLAGPTDATKVQSHSRHKSHRSSCVQYFR